MGSLNCQLRILIVGRVRYAEDLQEWRGGGDKLGKQKYGF